MLTPETVEALTAAMTTYERTVHSGGWDADPVLIGMFRATSAPTDRAIEVDPLPLAPRTWSIPDPFRPGHNLPPTFALQAVADILPTRGASWLDDWLYHEGRVLISIGFLFEGWRSRPYEGYRLGDLRDQPAMAEEEVRMLAANDLDGRHYQIARVRDGDEPAVHVDDDPSPSLRGSTIGLALTQLMKLADGR